ncbi:MAG: hypothetical protein HYY84_18450 [Deltaproteobacteria bacterium]|nr:hypothetical protein [Deltaproteobacteria bacterium]
MRPIDVAEPDNESPVTTATSSTRLFKPHVAGRLVFIFAVLLRFPAIVYGPATIEEHRLAAGGAMLAAGGTMFVDVVDYGSPVDYATYAAVYALSFPFNHTGIVILAMLLTVATALLLGAAVRRIAGDDAGAVAALGYVLFSPSTANLGALAVSPPLLATFFLTVALWAWLEFRARANGAFATLAGLAAGLASLYVGPYALVLIVIVFIVDSRTFGFAAFGTSLVPWIITVGIVESIPLGLDYLMRYQALRTLDSPEDALGTIGIAVLQLAIPLAIVIYAALRNFRAFLPREHRFVLFWLAASLIVPIVAKGRGTTSFLPLLPPLLVVAAPHFAMLARRSPRLILAATFTPVLLLTAFQWARPKFESLLDPNRIDLTSPVAAIRHATRVTDPIFVWGKDAERLYVAAERRPASRHFQPSLRYHPKFRDEQIVSDFERQKPRIVIDLGPEKFKNAHDLAEHVEKFYRLIETGRDYRIYARQ